jgi:ABC-type taurine transport system substrate-binding protein
MLAFGASFTYGKVFKPENATLVFADASNVWWTAPTIIANIDQLYDKADVQVKAFDVMSGLDSMKAVLAGNADIGLVASTPLALAAAKGEKLIVLGKYVSSDQLLSLLSEVDILGSRCVKNGRDCDKLINSLTTVYVPNTISEFYLRQFLKAHNLGGEFDAIKKRSLTVLPPAVANTFGKPIGDGQHVNTAVIWEPFAQQIRDNNKSKQNGETSLKMQAPEKGIYNMALYLVTTPEVWDKKKGALFKFARAVKAADRQITEKSDENRIKIEQKLGHASGWLKESWPNVEFKFDTSRERIKYLIDTDAALAQEVGIIKTRPDVSYMLTKLDEVAAATQDEQPK